MYSYIQNTDIIEWGICGWILIKLTLKKFNPPCNLIYFSIFIWRGPNRRYLLSIKSVFFLWEILFISLSGCDYLRLDRHCMNSTCVSRNIFLCKVCIWDLSVLLLIKYIFIGRLGRSLSGVSLKRTPSVHKNSCPL